jgi:serine/threonine protein kinase
MQGTIVNGYTLQRLLGSGGMAEVWYAQNEIGKPAAVKILNDNLSNNEQIVERFHNEALIMVKLSHPNIRQVYSYGYIGNRHCIIQEYLEGTDLESLLKSGRHFTNEELQRWWNQTADALNYTHAMGIVHRDIKPSNLFLDSYGNIKLLDFGIAKVRESISMTRTGAVMGTLMYMSPEQVKDSKYIDHRTDIYSLAVTFVHLLSGKAPYDIDTSGDYEVRKGIVEQSLDLSGVPATWRGFLTPYLNKEPDQRPALRHFEEMQPVEEQVKQPVVPIVEEATLVVETSQPEPKSAPKPQPKPVELETQSSELSDKPNNKTGLWIALGVVAAAAVLLLLLLKPKKEEPVVVAADPDTEAYQACYYVNDYRTYIAEYGRNAHHYSEAKQFVDNYVADSIAKAQQAIAEAQARQQAEAEEQAQAEAKQKEDEAYQKCTTVAACNNYLKTYPQGRYVAEVETKKANLEEKAQQQASEKAEAEVRAQAEAEKREDEAYRKCTTIAGCESYLKAYPQGRYVSNVRAKKTQMEQEAQQVTNRGSANGHDYVDLGLPSGTLWATCNVGASRPEGYGNFYAWGETRMKNAYNYDTYKYAMGSYENLTKYCTKSERGNNGFSDNLTTLQSGDDPAMVNWGNGWYTPSKTQWEELLNNTTKEWVTRNSVKGWVFTGKNGQTLFLPAAGWYNRWYSDHRAVGTSCSYWSRSLVTDEPYSAWVLCGMPDRCSMSKEERVSGLTVRPVRQK